MGEDKLIYEVGRKVACHLKYKQLRESICRDSFCLWLQMLTFFKYLSWDKTHVPQDNSFLTQDKTFISRDTYFANTTVQKTDTTILNCTVQVLLCCLIPVTTEMKTISTIIKISTYSSVEFLLKSRCKVSRKLSHCITGGISHTRMGVTQER